MYVSNVPSPDRPVLATFKHHNDAFAWMEKRQVQGDRRGVVAYVVAWLAVILACVYLTITVAP